MSKPVAVTTPRWNLSASASVGFGAAAVALSLCGLYPWGLILSGSAFIPASIAAVLSQVGLARSHELGGTGRRLAITGLVLGCVGVALIFITPTAWILFILVLVALSPG